MLTHNQKIRDLADEYAKSKGLKLRHDETTPLNQERAHLIAKAFDEMPHNPKDPKVKKAYDALIGETLAQFQGIKKSGIKMSPIEPGMANPYKTSADMLKDVSENNHIYFYPTDQGFGGADDKTSDHPLLQPTSEKLNGKPLLANDIFRITHDIYGHAKEGNSFGPKGEEAAWQHHMQMYTPEAQKALTTETRGQNSWVNFGPKGEANRANPQNTQFAEQKAGILPDFASETTVPQKMAEGGEAFDPQAYLQDGQSADESFDPQAYLNDKPQETTTTPTQKSLTGQPAEPETDSFDPQAYLNEPKQSNDKYSTPGQQLLTGLEGAGQGFAGPVATLAEKGLSALGVPGLTAEDQLGRQEANPIEYNAAKWGSLTASMMLGTGEAGLLAKGLGKVIPEAIPIFGKLGSAVISNALQGIAIQGGDEMSKALLGQGDPNEPVSSTLAHMGYAGLIGGVTGGMFNIAGRGAAKGLEVLKNQELGTKAEGILAGMGAAAKAHETGETLDPKLMQPLFKKGVEFYNNGIQDIGNKLSTKVADIAVGTAVGSVMGPTAGTMAALATDKQLRPLVEKVLNRPLTAASKYAAPVILHALQKGQTSGLFTLLNYSNKTAAGAKMIGKGVESLFKGTALTGVNLIANEKDKQNIMDYIDKGGAQQELNEATPQGFAEGGPVMPQQDHVANLYPEQNMIMNTIKARTSNYLNSLKPRPNLQKLPYDRTPDTTHADRKYDKAVSMAAAPLCIFKDIKDGTLQAEHMQHLQAMYPEFIQHVQKQITQRLVQGQLDEETMPYKTRQSLAMFLGQPLDTTMTPTGIQAAQQTFLPKQTPQQGQQQGKTKKGTSTLGKSNKEYRTTTQAAESDRTVRD